MIDLRQELQDYSIINLKDISQNESEIPDNIRNSIFLYNKAIESIGTGSEDIAIIELKKAISMNPHFYEAMNLLGLCYSFTKDNAKAAETFDKVIKAEQNSVRALRYMSLLNSSDDTGSGRNKVKTRPVINTKKEAALKESVLKRKDVLKKQNQPKSFNSLKYIAFFVAGILVFFIINSIISKPEEKKDDSGLQNITQTDKSNDEYKAKYEDLSSKYQLLQNDKNATNKEIDYYKSVIKLYEIESLANNKNYGNAADMLLLMKTVEFNGDDKTKFDNLYGTIMPKAAWAVYDDGYKLYNSRKYEECLKKFEKVEVYDPKFNRLDAVLYYMGKSYQHLNDSRNAIAVYQKLIDTFPKSSYAYNAKSKIKTLTQQP
jgi:Uncharacterized protein conserved in bacteria